MTATKSGSNVIVISRMTMRSKTQAEQPQTATAKAVVKKGS
jgi:hypothetical protein